MRPERLVWVVWLCLLLPSAGFGHKPSDSYLTLDLREAPAQLRWDIALRDLDYALAIDTDADRSLTWGEVRTARAAIERYAIAHLQVRSGDRACVASAGQQRLADHVDGTYAVLALSLHCGGGAPTQLRYDLLFELDPTHRGLLRVITHDGERAGVFSPDHSRIELSHGENHGIASLIGDFLIQGMQHIWIGLDHVLFLLTLLLAIGLERRDGLWHAVADIRRAGRKALLVVTAFTAAHSITLALAVHGLVALPSRWVESAIAATVLIAAVNNIRPFLPGRTWIIAFVLGLVHGLGFASVLAELGLTDANTAIALLGFNLGVEVGQLALVLLFVPLVYGFRRAEGYRNAGLQLGSAGIGAIALVWLIERSAGLELIPF